MLRNTCITSTSEFLLIKWKFEKKDTCNWIFFFNFMYCTQEIFFISCVMREWIIICYFVLSVDARPHRSSLTTRRRTCPCLRTRRRQRPAESSSSTMDTGPWPDRKVKEDFMNGWKYNINLPTCISLQFYAIDIYLIGSNYRLHGLMVGMYDLWKYYRYILLLEKHDHEIVLTFR